jgi:thioredoxin 1
MIKITTNNFKNEVSESKVPVIIDFWAEWCNPCRMMSPVFESVSGDYKGKVKFCKVNVDEEEELAARFDVRTIPSLIFIKNDKEKDRLTGFISREKFKIWIEGLL